MQNHLLHPLLSTMPIVAFVAGTKLPICAMKVIKATCLPYADLPEPFAPVMTICSVSQRQWPKTYHASEPVSVFLFPSLQCGVVGDVVVRQLFVQQVPPLFDFEDRLLRHKRLDETVLPCGIGEREQTAQSALTSGARLTSQVPQSRRQLREAPAQPAWPLRQSGLCMRFLDLRISVRALRRLDFRPKGMTHRRSWRVCRRSARQDVASLESCNTSCRPCGTYQSAFGNRPRKTAKLTLSSHSR